MILSELRNHIDSYVDDNRLGSISEAMSQKFEGLFAEKASIISSLAPFLDPRMRSNHSNLSEPNWDLLANFSKVFSKNYKNDLIKISNEPLGDSTDKNNYFYKKAASLNIIKNLFIVK